MMGKRSVIILLKWKRFLAALMAAAAIAAASSMPAAAKDGYLDRAVDDNIQQLVMLSSKNPYLYCAMITPDPDERAVLREAAQEITAGCTTAAQKAAAIYRWVTTNLYYDEDSVSSGALPGGDPYSAYTTRVAVCEGFATLFAELMNAVDVPCVAFHGSSISDPLGIYMDSVSGWEQENYDTVNHAWNAAYIDGQWLYYDPTWDCGNKVVNGQRVEGSATRRYYAISAEDLGANHRTAYRINDDGAFRLIGDEWLFCDQNGVVYSGVWYDGYNSDLYYMEEGKPLTGRTVVDYQLIDFDSDGRYIRTLYDYTGWQLYRGDWYYIRQGIACYGWGYLGGRWYYLDPETSIMQTGWKYIGGAWYYLSSSGAMLTGWQYINGAWYYLTSSGAMATGWQYIGGKWYYLSSSGAMLTGWQHINGKWYYLYGDGSMAANTTIDGYYLNSQGTY